MNIQAEANFEIKSTDLRYDFDVFFPMQNIIDHFVENYFLEEKSAEAIERKLSYGQDQV